MGHLNLLTRLSVLILCIRPMLSNECPIGFTLEIIETMGKVCVKVNRNETFFEKYNRCTGNMVPLNFYRKAEFVNYIEHEEYWVDYVRSYEYGPFINWLVGDKKMGRHVFLLKGDVEDGTKLCAVVNLRTSSYRAVDCMEKYPRFCVIPTYDNSDLASWNCSDEYIPFMSPIPACLTAPIVSNASRKAPLRARFEQARNVCLKHDGYLLHKGYIYSNHPEFLRVTERFTELPLGIMRLSDKFFWKDYPDYPNGEEITPSEYNFISHEDFNSNKTIVSLESTKWKLVDQQHIFYNVMCEYFFQLPVIKLKILGNTVITHPLILKFDEYNISEKDILCFTDSVTYHPTPVSISKYNSFSYILDCKEDGYYWCMLQNTKEYISKPSDKVLYIEDKEALRNRYAMVLCMTWPFNHHDLKIEEIEEYVYEYFNGKKTLADVYDSSMEEKSIFPNGTFVILKRVLENRELLIHVKLNCTSDKCTTDQYEFLKNTNYEVNRIRVGYVRHVAGCNGDKFGEVDIFYNFGDEKSDECAIYKCAGDFDFGGYWNITTRKRNKNCVYDENYPSLDICQKDEITTEYPEETTDLETTPDTTESTIGTTTPSPEQQVDNLGTKLEELAGGGPVSSEQLKDTTNDINKVLDLGNNVVVPKSILTNLDLVVNKVEIPEGQSNVAIIEPNIAIIVGERSGSNPLLGIIVDGMEDSDDFEDNNIHVLTNDSTVPSSKTEVFVQIPPSGSHIEERLSFVLFKNENAFVSNNSQQKVNSRVVNILMGKTTKFRDGQYIDINFKPHADEVQRNQTRVCAYWDFKIGENGDWSTHGCKLLSKQKNGLDTCRCDHLTHFAQIIRPDKDFGDLHYTILTIITDVGCILSLISLIIIGLTGAIFKSWRRDFSNKVWLHLSGSVALLIIAFLIIAFVDVHKDRSLCLASGIILHYSVLASFCWMFISAVLSYQRLVKVFTKSSSHRLLKACLVGWLIPALPIIILCAVDAEIYSLTKGIGTLKKAFCYPEGLAFWFTIILPIAAIVLANMILFCIIIYSVFMNSKIQRHGDTKQLYRSITVSFLLFFLFGLTWIFGLLSDNIVMAYLFCIAATIQGFVLFIFFILGNKKTRDLWAVQLRLKDKTRMPVTSSMSKSVSRGVTSNSKIVSLKTIDYHNNTTPKFLTGNFEDSDSRFS